MVHLYSQLASFHPFLGIPEDDHRIGRGYCQLQSQVITFFSPPDLLFSPSIFLRSTSWSFLMELASTNFLNSLSLSILITSPNYLSIFHTTVSNIGVTLSLCMKYSRRDIKELLLYDQFFGIPLHCSSSAFMPVGPNFQFCKETSRSLK